MDAVADGVEQPDIETAALAECGKSERLPRRFDKVLTVGRKGAQSKHVFIAFAVRTAVEIYRVLFRREKGLSAFKFQTDAACAECKNFHTSFPLSIDTVYTVSSPQDINMNTVKKMVTTEQILVHTTSCVASCSSLFICPAMMALDTATGVPKSAISVG